MTTAEQIVEQYDGCPGCGGCMGIASCIYGREDLVSHFVTQQGTKEVEVFVFEDGSSINVWDSGDGYTFEYEAVKP